MNQKQVVDSLLDKASKYREFARWIGGVLLARRCIGERLTH